jgi:hypothetical protein
MKPSWQFCPYCSNQNYPVIDDKIPEIGIQSGPSHILESERVVKKGLTTRKKRALIIGAIILAVAIITPIASILVHQYLFPQRIVNFYVNNGKNFTSYRVSTTREILDFYEREPHPFHADNDPFNVASIIESFCTPNYSKILEIAEDIQSKCIDQYDSEEVLNALLSFTQAIGYRTELIDITKYPMETLFNQGDCEDLSVLFGSLVVSLGYDAILAVINYYDTDVDDWIGHASVGVYLNFTPTHQSSYPPSNSFTVNSKEYWICETTSMGWMIGQLPTANPSHYLMEGYAIIN